MMQTRGIKPAVQHGMFTIVLACMMTAGAVAQPVQGSGGAATTSLYQQTELRFWDSSRTWNGYTLFASRGTYLIDMLGRVVKTWNIGTNPRLLDNGHLLDASKPDPSGFSGFVELDWDGNQVWSYTESRAGYSPHHDWVRIFNRKLGAYTTLYIANKSITSAQALAAGASPASGPYNGAQMDAIVEVDMNGTVVWEWWFFDHVVQDVDSTKLNWVGTGRRIADHPGRININMPGKPLRKDWLHCNSIDYNDSLDQIVINSVHGEFYVIDHGGTFTSGDPAASIAAAASAKGDFLYRFGDPARYNQGLPPTVSSDWTQSSTGNKQIGGSHDVHWIRPGLPGEGGFLIFNNGEYLFEQTSQSYIFEVNPHLDAQKIDTRGYVNPPDAGYWTLKSTNKDTFKQPKLISNQVVWVYNAMSNLNFFSHIGGSAQRLPNGNTLICSDTDGTLFEVTNGDSTHAPEVVWQYVNPVTEDGIKRVIPDNYPMYNSVFRTLRYAADHPALRGRTLVPGQTLTGMPPTYFTPADLVTSSSMDAVVVPTLCVLEANHPNPFSASTSIGFTLRESAGVSLQIRTMEGRLISTLVADVLPAGRHVRQFDASGVAGGACVCTLIVRPATNAAATPHVESRLLLVLH